MEYYYMTDPGKVRDHNEDSVIIAENLNKEILMAVADGMGGHNAGEIASSIAISHIGKRFKEISSVGNKEDAINWLQETVSEINVLIYKYTEEHPESAGMGTTFVVLICIIILCKLMSLVAGSKSAGASAPVAAAPAAVEVLLSAVPLSSVPGSARLSAASAYPYLLPAVL